MDRLSSRGRAAIANMRIYTCESDRLGISLLRSIGECVSFLSDDVHSVEPQVPAAGRYPSEPGACRQGGNPSPSPHPHSAGGLASGPPAQLPALWPGLPACLAGTVLPSPGAPTCIWDSSALLCPGLGQALPVSGLRRLTAPTQHVLPCKLWAAVVFHSFTRQAFSEHILNLSMASRRGLVPEIAQ